MRPLAMILLCSTVLTACSQAVRAPRLRDRMDVPPAAAVRNGQLKVHLLSGELVVLSSWAEQDATLTGRGTRYDLERRPSGQGRHAIPFDSIALLETEVRVGSRPSGIGGLAVWTTLMSIVTIGCVADPKACFGSCPTFYVTTDSGEALAVEGFSSSIARALEAKDLDALYPARPDAGAFTVRMRNEAWETHAVRGLTLVAAPRPASGRVFAGADGRLYPATSIRAPAACTAPEGDCRGSLAAPDGAERTSPADSADLNARETIELTFPAATGRLGLVLGARQSLMSTYLFYQTMGFLGTRAGEALAALERGGPDVAGRAMGMARMIGPIDVDVWDGAGWKRIGTHDEAGPLATHYEALPFSHEPYGPVRVRVTLVKGAWRLDWIALAELGDPVKPVRLAPEGVLRDGNPDSAAYARLIDRGRHLVTYPGDTYDVVFRLPPSSGGWETFLESEGFYYEWMRAEWLDDENAELAALALTDPATALRVLAPAFTLAEPEMERVFWSSRFGR